MKSKILSFLFAVASGFILTAVYCVASFAAEKPQCLLTLSTATKFEDRQVGEGEKSKIYKAYEEAFRNSDSIRKEDFEWLLKSGTPAGKIYAAMLLRGTGKANDADSFGKISNDQTKIDFQSGCEVMEDTLGAIAKSFIKTGEYLGTRYLTKSKSKNEESHHKMQ